MHAHVHVQIRRYSVQFSCVIHNPSSAVYLKYVCEVKIVTIPFVGVRRFLEKDKITDLIKYVTSTTV